MSTSAIEILRGAGPLRQSGAYGAYGALSGGYIRVILRAWWRQESVSSHILSFFIRSDIFSRAVAEPLHCLDTITYL